MRISHHVWSNILHYAPTNIRIEFADLGKEAKVAIRRLTSRLQLEGRLRYGGW